MNGGIHRRRSRNHSGNASSKPVPVAEKSVAATYNKDSKSIATITGWREITAIVSKAMDMISWQASFKDVYLI